MASDCLFCKIIAGAIPATLVFQDDQLVALRDINPVAPMHILFIPRRHVASLAETGPGDQALLGGLLAAAARQARAEGLAEDGYRVVINTGQDGGQSVSHLHLHLIGGRAMHWPPG